MGDRDDLLEGLDDLNEGATAALILLVSDFEHAKRVELASLLAHHIRQTLPFAAPMLA